MATLRKYGMGRSTFMISNNENVDVGFIIKHPKSGSIGKWDWFWMSLDQNFRTGPFTTKQKALDAFLVYHNLT